MILLDAASDSNFPLLKRLLDNVEDIELEKYLLLFQDSDRNTALHLGAKNGNFKICNYLIDTAKQRGVDHQLINCRNAMGFTPLLYVCFRGYRTIGEKEVSLDNRYRIVEKLLEVGAD